ncbi:hypothetical protein [Clostridium sp.]|uniref:hypothetical protein n=1 Tax=Clostridium sp. TaxID=1506 RepID=UPI0039955E43
MGEFKQYIWPTALGFIGLIIGLLVYFFYEANIVILVSLIILGILIGFRIIRNKR